MSTSEIKDLLYWSEVTNIPTSELALAKTEFERIFNSKLEYSPEMLDVDIIENDIFGPEL